MNRAQRMADASLYRTLVRDLSSRFPVFHAVQNVLSRLRRRNLYAGIAGALPAIPYGLMLMFSVAER